MLIGLGNEKRTTSGMPTALLTRESYVLMSCLIRDSHANLRNFKPATPKPSIPNSTAPGTGTTVTTRIQSPGSVTPILTRSVDGPSNL